MKACLGLALATTYHKLGMPGKGMSLACTEFVIYTNHTPLLLWLSATHVHPESIDLLPIHMDIGQFSTP